MNPATQLYNEPTEVDHRLFQLGLTRHPFVKAAQEGLAAFVSCTASHPPTFPGTFAWAESNRSLRDNLFDMGWTRKNETNQPLVLNANGSMALTSASGDKHTGIKESFPATASSKGKRTGEAIRANNYRFDFMEYPDRTVASAGVSNRSTWIFLIFRDVVRGELRYELSLPRSMSKDGHVDDWVERIIFPSTPFDTTVPKFGDDDGKTPEISVEIRKLG